MGQMQEARSPAKMQQQVAKWEENACGKKANGKNYRQ